MTLSDLSIKRPVMAWMLMAALIVFGSIALGRLPVSYMPDYDFPVLTISAKRAGAAPEVMEAQVVDRLEQALVSVEKVRDITSSIRQGQCSIMLEFELDRDVDAALQEVQSKLSSVRLPTDMDAPTITKNNPDDQPIIFVGVSSETRSMRDLIVFADLYIKDQFQILPGVGEITLNGFADRNLRIHIDNEKLKPLELTVLDVLKAIELQHTESAAGYLENQKNEINVRAMGEGMTVQQIENILITHRGGKPIYQTEIRLRDVAKVEDGLENVRRITRICQKPGLGLGIKKQRDANSVEVGRTIKKKVEELQKTLPKDVEIGINFDTTVFIKESIDETLFTLVLSALVTGLVCFLFLGSWESTFNVLLSIPTSIIGSFLILYFMGFTLNMFTILGLALAVGIVVDDAIMVLENIVRHLHMHKGRVAASRDGAREITFAAVAASVAVVAIFLPVAFMVGIIGKFFFQFGVTISGAVALSLLEAITLTPMRCSQFLNEREPDTRIARGARWTLEKLSSLYVSALHRTLVHRWKIVAGALAIFALSLLLAKQLRGELIPPQDQSMFMLRYQSPVGTSLALTSEKLKAIESYAAQRPEVRRFMAAVGGFGGGEVNTGIMFISLHPKDKREKGQEQIMDEFRKDLRKLTDLRVNIQDLSMRGFTAKRGFPIEFNIRGSDWAILYAKSKEITERLKNSGYLTDIDTDYRLGQPEARVIPDREKAAQSGVTMDDISRTIETAIGGVKRGEFTGEGRRYDVRVGLEAMERLTPDDIMALQIRTSYGELIPISDVVRIENISTLQTITRQNRQRSISFFANVAPGKSQTLAVQDVEKICNEVLPEGYRMFLGGGAATFKESFRSLGFALLLGVIVAYMVLASQFNSFVHPFTILFSLPFSITGALGALWLSNQSINLYSFIGILLLMGIVKKNAILLVEFANHKREEGASVRDALLEAARTRLRPILMTSTATLAAAIPPALALGPGAESRIPMAVTVIGGVLVSTIFTLFVVPCVYSLFSKVERH